MKWYVLCVKKRNEINVSQALEQFGIKTYCPVMTEIHQWSDRKKKVIVPVFNSYVFVYLHDSDCAKVFDVPYVKSYLFWLGKRAIVRDEEMVFLKKYLSENALKISTNGIKLGDKIFIKEGYFKGLEGVVNQINKNRLQLLLTEMSCKITLATH